MSYRSQSAQHTRCTGIARRPTYAKYQHIYSTCSMMSTTTLHPRAISVRSISRQELHSVFFRGGSLEYHRSLLVFQDGQRFSEKSFVHSEKILRERGKNRWSARCRVWRPPNQHEGHYAVTPGMTFSVLYLPPIRSYGTVSSW